MTITISEIETTLVNEDSRALRDILIHDDELVFNDDDKETLVNINILENKEAITTITLYKDQLEQLKNALNCF